MRACALLAPTSTQRVLDVGSGVGKLCLVGAATTRATWTGAELDVDMIREAREAARQMGLDDRATFLHQDATQLDWTAYDAIYFFNPFAEGFVKRYLDITARMQRFFLTLERARRRLLTTRPGTRIVTYHGIGGEMPDGFTLLHREAARQDSLCLWIRNDASAQTGVELSPSASPGELRLRDTKLLELLERRRAICP